MAKYSRGYELPEGWRPIASYDGKDNVSLLYADGEIMPSRTGGASRAIGWQPITAPKQGSQYTILKDHSNGTYTIISEQKGLPQALDITEEWAVEEVLKIFERLAQSK